MKSKFNQLYGNWGFLISGIPVFFISAGFLWFVRDDVVGKNFFMIACLTASYYAYHNRNKEKLEQITRGILIGFATLMFAFLIIQTIKAGTSNNQWDFMCFYMQGLLGVNHLDFYDPNSFRIVLEKLNFQYPFDAGFKAEIFDVGLLSPPITMLLFDPIASLDYKTSRLMLSMFIFLFIIINTILAKKIFVKNEPSFYSYLFIFIIIMIIPGTNHTISWNQTTFFILFFLFLVMNYFDKPAAGVFLALSIIIKPISGILILFFVINKKWKIINYFLLTTLVLFALTGVFWGFHNILEFFKSPPTLRIPLSIYVESTNHSIIGILNRNIKDYLIEQTLIKLIYYILTVGMLVLTIFASRRLLKINKILSLLPFLPFMLMIYPSSQGAYMVFIIPLLLYFLFLKNGEKYLWILLIPALSFSRTELFYTYLLLWLVLIIIAFLPQKYNNSNKDLRFDFT